MWILRDGVSDEIKQSTLCGQINTGLMISVPHHLAARSVTGGRSLSACHKPTPA